MYLTIDRIIENPTHTAEDEHILWMKEKQKDGWVYGEETDRSKKIHNCLLPYSKLSGYQKMKDMVVVNIINMWLQMIVKQDINKDISILRGNN